MDFDYTSSSILFLISCFLFVFVFFVKTHGRKPNMNLPPGPWKLPFIGSLHHLAAAVSAPPHRVLANLASKYGPVMHLQLGEVGAVVISSPETAKEYLKTNGTVFASRPSFQAMEILLYGRTDVAFSPYGDYWRQLRKIFSLQLFTATRVQSFRPIREEENSDHCKLVAANAGSTINLTEILANTNLNIMVRAAFGGKTGPDAEVGTLTAMIKEGHILFTVFDIADVYPSLRFLRLFSRMRKWSENVHQQVDRITEGIIEKRRRENEEGGSDLLGVLMKLQADGSLQIPLSTDNIKAILMDGVGVEESTIVVDWAMAEMLKNPPILNKAQDEVRSLFHAKNHVEESCFDQLNYLKLVIKETLRLHPPGPLLLPRESTDRCQVQGYEIPAKTWVLVNAWAIGRDPKYWEDAESFKPERFLEKEVDFKATAMEYIPFGAGKRICPGIAFGIANVEIQLAMLLYHFDWILPHGMKPEELDMEEAPGLSGRRKLDLNVIPIIRRPLV